MRTRKNQEYQRIIQRYRDETGTTALDMHVVAEFALQLGCRAPRPVSPVDLLARELSRAAREQTRRDKITKRSYRVYHAFPAYRDGAQVRLWVDIDEAQRGPMAASLSLRRQQMVDDGYHLALDADHWNSIHPEEDPIRLVFDFSDDVEERKNAPEEAGEAS
jgi:hypothetical protein